MDKQDTTFYETLKLHPEIDLRDNRGKIHEYSFVLLGVLIGLLRNRDGKLSSIHRSMINKHKELCAELGEVHPKISRSQLSKFLVKIDVVAFEKLLLSIYGIKLSAEQRRWFAADGKELKGSIEKGNKRGEVLVQAIDHETGKVLGQQFYQGRKESEKKAVRALIAKSGAGNQKWTMDALHFNPKTTQLVHGQGGTYLIGLKENQKELLGKMRLIHEARNGIDYRKEVRVKHGRLEVRTYYAYNIAKQEVDARWAQSGFQLLLVRKCFTAEVKTGKMSTELEFYISNGEQIPEMDEYFDAIRQHWSIEVNHHIRDVTLKEDKLRTKKSIITKSVAGLRSIAISILQTLNPKNLTAMIEDFQDDFGLLMKALTKLKIL